jgi:cysteinyl-tRNA synthetase
VFPHHENELAQTCCAFHSDRMANVWMHNGFLQLESEKMSKSLGNFFTIREMLADWPGEVLRLSMLKTHYRSPLDWTTKGAEESAKTLDDWYVVAADAEGGQPSPAIIEALYDDLNTAQAMAVLHGLRNAAASGGARERGEFAASLRLLGFLSMSAAAWKGRKQQASGIDAEQVDRLIAERARERTLRSPTASATNSLRWALPSRTARMPTESPSPHGRSRDDETRYAFSKTLALLHFRQMGADRCRRLAGLATVRSVLTRWDRHCPNPACGRVCRRILRCWRRSSLPPSRN